jgi:O-antigen ligase
MEMETREYQAFKQAPAWVAQQGWLLVAAFVLVMPYGHAFELPMALMAVIGGWMLAFRTASVKRLPASRGLAVLTACFLLPMLISLPDAVNASRALETTLSFIRFPLAGIFVLLALREEVARHRLLMWMGLGLSFSAICVDLQAMQGHFMNLPGPIAKVIHYYASERAVGHVLAVFSPIYFYWVWQQGRQQPWIWLLALGYAAAVFFSGARVAWIMLAVSLLLLAMQLIFVERVKLRMKPLLIGALLIAAALGAAMQQPVLKARVQQTAGLFSGNYEQTNQATSARLPIWRVAISVAEDHWFNGIGPRGFRYVYAQYAPKDDFWMHTYPLQIPNHPHQQLLEIAVETGMIGVVGYFLALAYWVRLGVSAAREKLQQTLPGVVAVLIALMPINAHMAFYASFWSSITWWLMALALAFWQWGTSKGQSAV